MSSSIFGCPRKETDENNKCIKGGSCHPVFSYVPEKKQG
jgi:hypothetical protein